MLVSRSRPYGSNSILNSSRSLKENSESTLTGPGFKIDPVTPERQTIAEGFPTVWEWNVEAKDDGEEELEATLYAVVSDGNKNVQHRVDSYTQKIKVSVRDLTWGERFQSVAHEIDTAKAIVLSLGAIATALLAGLG